MKFGDKYAVRTGLDSANASWAGPGWRGAFCAKTDAALAVDMPMESGVEYIVGFLPAGFDARKACLDVKEAAVASGTTLSVTVRKPSTGATAWTIAAAASLSAVAATYYTGTLPGPLTEEHEIVIKSNKAVPDVLFALEIVGDVFRVGMTE